MKYAETLYVPKDSFSADSTLGSIFLKYLKKKAGRDQFDCMNRISHMMKDNKSTCWEKKKLNILYF